MSKKICNSILSFILLSALLLGSRAGLDQITVSDHDVAAASISYTCENVKVGSRFGELIFGRRGSREDGSKDNETIYLCPGGDAFGVKICTGSVTVSKVITELSTGKLLAEDKILKIDGKEISSVSDVKELVNLSGGAPLTFEISREGRVVTEAVTPIKIGDVYHLGVILNDTASGIGTVTYYDPKTNEFGGLGHGITEKDGTDIACMTHGIATGVILGGAMRGKAGHPGELRGVLTDRTIGEVYANTECGIFGILKDAPLSDTSALPCAKKGEVKAGDATIITTVKSGKRAEYSIRISDIDKSSDGTKSFRITVTDDALIALTGGIVRGMSGSPIIQDGKLVGAVTHVLINDPTTGYGIFIENMLNASEIARNELPAA